MEPKSALPSNRLVLTTSRTSCTDDFGLIFSPGLSSESVAEKSRKLGDSFSDAFLRLIRYSPNAISKKVESIAGVTAEIAKGAEQSAQASQSLNAQAEELQSIVEQFKLNV